MSRENVELVRRVYEAAARRDAETVLSLYHPDVVWDMSSHPYGDMWEGGVAHGHSGLRTWFRDWYEAFETFEHDCHELRDAGDTVISVGTDRGRGRGSGAEVKWKNISGVWTIRDGKVVRVVWFATREQALDAAGLLEDSLRPAARPPGRADPRAGRR